MEHATVPDGTVILIAELRYDNRQWPAAESSPVMYFVLWDLIFSTLLCTAIFDHFGVLVPTFFFIRPENVYFDLYVIKS